MRIKDHTDMVRHLTDPFNIPEARRMIAENPALTQEQFKAGGRIGFKFGGSWADWKANHEDQMSFEEYLKIDMDKPVHPINKSTGGRIGLQSGQLVQPGPGYKPGGLVEPGVTHYGTTTDVEAIEFYNDQVLKKDSLYNKYKQERYTKIYDKPFEKLTTDEKRVIKKVHKNFKRLLPNLKKAEGLIKVSEASKILGLPESKGTEGLATRISDVLSRTGARGGQGREFIKNVLKPKFGFTTLDIGEGKPSMFMKNPENVKDGVKILQDFYLRKGAKFGITPEVLQRVKELHKNPKIVNAFLEGDLKKTLKLIGAKGWTGSQGSTAMFRLAQLYDGKKFINVDFKLPKNKKVSEGIFDNIAKAPFTNVFHSRGYQIAMDEITQALGDDYFGKGSMESFKKRVRRILKEQKLGKWQINEMIGVTPTTRTGAHPYSQFINLMKKKFNEGQYSDFVKQFGNYQIDLQKEIKKGARGSPSSVIEKFDNYSKNFKELHKMKATDLPTLSLQDPSKLYTDTRLRQLSDQGLDLSKHFKKTGYSIGVGDAPTLKEYITNPKETRALISKIGCPGLAGGGRATFKDGSTCYSKGLEKVKAGNIKTPGEKANFRKLAKTAGGLKGIARMTGLGLAWEAAVAPVVAAWMMPGGESPARILNELAYGLPIVGETEKEELKRHMGETGFNVSELRNLSGDREYLQMELNEEINRSGGREGKSYKQYQIEQQIKKLDEKVRPMVDYFYEGPAGQYFGEEKWGSGEEARVKGLESLEQSKADWIKKYQDLGLVAKPGWKKNFRTHRMGGGIMGLKK